MIWIFVFNSNKQANLKFAIPAWVNSNWSLLKINDKKIDELNYSFDKSGFIIFNDKITEVGKYVLVENSLNKSRQIKQLRLAQAKIVCPRPGSRIAGMEDSPR